MTHCSAHWKTVQEFGIKFNIEFMNINKTVHVQKATKRRKSKKNTHNHIASNRKIALNIVCAVEREKKCEQTNDPILTHTHIHQAYRI